MKVSESAFTPPSHPASTDPTTASDLKACEIAIAGRGECDVAVALCGPEPVARGDGEPVRRAARFAAVAVERLQSLRTRAAEQPRQTLRDERARVAVLAVQALA